MGLYGPIAIRRARFQCALTGQVTYPLDEVLDLPAGDTTVSLARRALSLGTKMGFAELQAEMLEQHDVRLTDSTLDTLMQKVGGVAAADRQEELEALAAQPPGYYREQLVAVTGPTPARLYISCDGITYRTRYREEDPQHPGEKRLIYQEMKVGAVYWQDAAGTWHKRVVVGRDDPERFGLSLWQLAVACGMLNCPDVVFISDGGLWCDTVARMYFPHARRILDWYHLSEHVWATARALYPAPGPAAGRWAYQCLDHLAASGGQRLLEHLARCQAARRGAAAAEVQALRDYLEPRQGFTQYAALRAKNYKIGSGMIESTCKQVVGRRLKGTGMQWSESGALAMASLVAKKLNNQWFEFWQTRPLQRAA